MLQYIIALISISVFLFLILKKPEIETYLLFVMFGLPFIDTKILPLEYGFIKTFDVITVISLIVFFKPFFHYERRGTSWGYLILILLFWILTLISNWYSEFGFTNYYLLYQIFTVFIFTRFLIIHFSTNWENRHKLISAFKMGFSIALVIMALQIIIGLEVTYYTAFNPNVYNESSGLIRYPGIFSESQYNGQFLAMGSLVFLTLQEKFEGKGKYLRYAGFLVGAVFVFMAGSRSAIGGLGAGLFVLLFFASARVKTLGFLAAAVLLGIFFIASPDKGIFSRTENISDDLDFRQGIWEETYEIIEEHPLLGIGFGNFEPYLTKYHQDMFLETSDNEILYFTQPENGYLKILVEQGYLTFFIFVLLITIPLFRALKGVFLKSIHSNTIFFVAALVSWLVAFNTVYSFLDYRLLALVGTWVTMLILHKRNFNSQFTERSVGRIPKADENQMVLKS